MRNPPSRVLLAAVVAAALLVGAAVPATGAAIASSPSPSLDAGSASTAAEPTAAAAEPTATDLSVPALSTTSVEQIDGEFDPNTATEIRIEPSPDRDARWIVSVRYELTNGNDTAAFEAAGEQFLDGEVGPDPALFEGFAREASRNVDRTMRIENVDREVDVHDDPSSFDVAGDEATAVGELRLTFVWTGFLEQDGENLVLGDALTTPNDGTWLLSLEAGQTLEVATPDGYTVTETPGATVPLRDNAVTIEGPRTFGEDERVAVVYAPAGTVGPPWTILAAAIVLAALLIAGSVVAYRRMGPGAGDGNGRADDGNGEIAHGNGGTDEGSGGAVQGSDAATASGTPAGTDDGRDGSDAHRVSEDETAPDSEAEDLSLLSDEERVERLLGDSGGRMRQADIVSETGWSDAKVSQLLSAMAEEGRVEKLRLGRENLISLPDDEDETDDSGESGSGSGRDGADAGGSGDPDGSGDPAGSGDGR